MYVGNFKVSKDNDGEIRSISLEFDGDIGAIDESFFNEEAFAMEIDIIDEMLKQLRLERARLTGAQKIIENRKLMEERIVKQMARLQAKLDYIRTGGPQ